MTDPLIPPGVQYEGEPLDPADVLPEPLAQVRAWLAEALATGVDEPTAMCLATADPTTGPSARMVLLKDIDGRGLTFFTNLESRKAGELDALPRAAIVMHWARVQRQVRATGPVERVDDATAAAYFASRARESRLGAWASRQSRPRGSRAELEAAVADAAARFPADIPLPPHWGGFRLVPDEVELWQGRPGRLHDRVVYRPDGQGWTRLRLDP